MGTLPGQTGGVYHFWAPRFAVEPLPLSSGSCVAVIETDTYYRRRFEEELAAAARTEDPSISQIHLELARRYRDMLSSEADRADGDAIRVESRGAPIANSGAVFG